MKKYVVNGQVFDVLCDAQELSYQLARNFYVKLISNSKRLEKFDDLSWGVYDRSSKQWLFISKVESSI